MITTSRYASEKTGKFAKKLARKLNTFYTSRGKKTIDQLSEQARRKGESEIIVVEEKENFPDTVSVIKVSELGEWKWARRKIPVNIYENEIKSGD